MQRWAVVGVGLIAIGAVLWWGFSPDEVTELTYSPAGTVEKRTTRAKVGPPLGATPDAKPAQALDSSVALEDDVDDDGYVGEVSKVSDAEIEETLRLNAAFAAANVARFCALADSLSSDPVFRPTQGSRDSTHQMEKLFGVHSEDHGSTELPVRIRQSLMAGDGLELTAEQLNSIDFAWMRTARDYDTLEGKLSGGAMPWGERAYTPPLKMPYYYVRLRILRAAQIGDWEDAAKDIQAFATLIHTSGDTFSETGATKAIELALQTMDKLRANGVKVPEHLPLPTAANVKLHAALANDAFRFVTPGVSAEVQQKAFECAKRAGLGCMMVSNSLQTATAMRRVTETEPLAFDRGGCNAYRYKLLSKPDQFGFYQYGASSVNQQLRAESPLFGKLE